MEGWSDQQAGGEEKSGVEKKDLVGKQSRLREAHKSSGQGREGQRGRWQDTKRGKIKGHGNIAGSQELQHN